MNDKAWVVLTAGGQGTRFEHALPKQYIEIADQSVIAHSMDAFVNFPNLQGMIIVHPKDDIHIQAIQSEKSAFPVPIWTVVGGEQRFHSVANALDKIRDIAGPQDWVCVHDAVRPCVHPSDLSKLMKTLALDPVGGILASRVKDTLKRSDATGRITETVERSDCWHALTPQVFRFALLDKALKHIQQRQISVTDDAQAVQLLGYSPRVVEASHPNPKLTVLQDLPLIEYLLRRKSICTA